MISREIRTSKAKSLLVLAAAALAASPAMAQKQTPPAGGPPKPFSVPAHETYTLANGMKVTLVPYGNIPKVSFNLTLRSGGLNEPADREGLADITGELLKEGTASQSATALAESAARMGGSLNVTITADESSLDIDVLSEFGPDAAKLLADVAQHPLLPESELGRIKSNELRRNAVLKSQPGQIALARFRKLMYGDHPYAITLPSDEDINKTTIADVRKFFAENYGAARAHLYVAGRFDTNAVKKAIDAAFSGWPKGPAAIENVPKPKTQRLLDLTDRPNAPQSTVIVGLPVVDATSPDNVPLTVTNALLGGSFGSRITSNIREKLGCTYSPTSQVSRRFHDAYWAETADITTDCTGKSLSEIFKEIQRLQKEAPSAPELQGIQSYLSGIFIIQNSSRTALIVQLRYVDLQGLGDDYLKTYVQKVNAVTPGEVQAMTVKYIKPEEMTIVVVGDRSKITDQLAPYTSMGGQSK